MFRLFKPLTQKVAQVPGTLHYVGVKKAENVTLKETRYTPATINESIQHFPFELKKSSDEPGIHWLAMCGLHDISALEALGNHLGLHALVQEDILNTLHRPKLEDYDDYLLLVLKLLRFNKEEQEVEMEQVSIVLSSDRVVSFHERESGVMDTIRNRLQKRHGRIRKMGADYLFYSLMDAVVDQYFLALESMGEEIDLMEDRLLENPEPEIQHELHFMKQELAVIKRMVLPLREILKELMTTDSPLITEPCFVFFRDLYDHVTHILETTESYRETINGLRDLYQSQLGNKMNEIMKVLTIIATIFIPLTFIAGIYGMNFEVMPELKWEYGYFGLWGIMIIVAALLIYYFKRKKWL